MLRNFLRERHPSLYSELEERDIQLIALLYNRAKRGKPYIVIPLDNPSYGLNTIIDEAGLVFGSSSKWQGTTAGDLRDSISILSNIVFTGKYGGVLKLRIDKSFEFELDNYLEEAGMVERQP